MDFETDEEFLETGSNDNFDIEASISSGKHALFQLGREHNVGGPRKRMNHNEVERKRRHHQKDKLQDLREVVPTIVSDKASTIMILSKAKEYIDILKKQNAELQNHINMLYASINASAVSALDPSGSNSSLLMSSLGTTSRSNQGNSATQLQQLQQQQQQQQQQLSFEQPAQTSSPAHSHSGPLKPSQFQPEAMVDELRRENDELRARLHVVTQASFDGSSFLSSSEEIFKKRPSVADDDFDAFRKALFDRRESGGPFGFYPGAANSFNLQKGRDDSFSGFDNFLPAVRESTEESSNGIATSALSNQIPSLSTGAASGQAGPIHQFRAMLNHQSLNTPLYSKASTEALCPICVDKRVGVVMIDCDACHRWTHIDCANVDPKNIPPRWSCPSCCKLGY